MKNRILGLLLFSFVMVSSQTFAHHAHAVQSDMDHLLTITGTVAKFDLINPHETIRLDVKGEDGVVEQWSAYGGAPLIMKRVGWSSGMFKPGEKLTISGFPNRDGKKVMLHVRIERANGELVSISQTEQTELDNIYRKHNVTSIDKLPGSVHRRIGS